MCVFCEKKDLFSKTVIPVYMIFDKIKFLAGSKPQVLGYSKGSYRDLGQISGV